MLGLIAVGVLAGATLNFAPLYLAIPIGLILLPVVLLRRRRETEESELNRLGARRQRFTERDRETLTP